MELCLGGSQLWYVDQQTATPQNLEEKARQMAAAQAREGRILDRVALSLSTLAGHGVLAV